MGHLLLSVLAGLGLLHFSLVSPAVSQSEQQQPPGGAPSCSSPNEQLYYVDVKADTCGQVCAPASQAKVIDDVLKAQPGTCVADSPYTVYNTTTVVKVPVIGSPTIATFDKPVSARSLYYEHPGEPHCEDITTADPTAAWWRAYGYRYKGWKHGMCPVQWDFVNEVDKPDHEDHAVVHRTLGRRGKRVDEGTEEGGRQKDDAAPAFDGVIRFDPAANASVAYMIPPYKSNHASTLEMLPSGDLVAAWFSGEKEEAPGCAIVVARLPRGSPRWSAAATVSKDAKFSNQNPVLFFDNTTSTLHLFHSQAPAESGESAATILRLSSADGGKSWTKPEQYITTPGSFPRNRIIRRADGTILFPYYSTAKGHENWPVMAISRGRHIPSSSSGWTIHALTDGGELVQPTCMQLPKRSANTTRCFFRDRRAKNIWYATSKDSGATFDKPRTTVLPNNNAGIEGYPLGSGKVAMVFNPQTSGRDPIAIALSADGGVTWPQKRLLQHGNSQAVAAAAGGRKLLSRRGGDVRGADEAVAVEKKKKKKKKGGNEFSYPTILQTPSDGHIHIMFTYDRDTIKYMRITEGWVAAGGEDAATALPFW